MARMMNNKTSGKLIFTSYQPAKIGGEVKTYHVACFIAENHLEYLKVIPFHNDLPVGSIITGKVKNIVPNIQAAFVALDKEQHMGFLSLKDTGHFIITNRTNNGRLIQGDEILVQVIREPMKTKEAALSATINLSGRYAVVQSGSGRLLFSKKLSPAKKEILVNYLVQKAFITRDKQLIGIPDLDITIRTEAGRLKDSVSLLTEEIQQLTDAYQNLIEQAKMRTCYTVHHKPINWLQEIYNELSTANFVIEELVSDDMQMITTIKEFLPEDRSPKIRYYHDTSLSLQALYGLNSKIEELRHKNVWLPSGGYLCIEPTEAMVVIDVNTGKAIQKGNTSEELFAEINREAAIEIARQIRLRNLSGMIIIDFINMKEDENYQKLLEVVKTCVRNDFSKVNVYEFTRLGLLELTREKKSKALHEVM